MLYKECPYCRRLVKQGERCTCKRSQEMAKESLRQSRKKYDMTKRDKKSRAFYNSSVWKKLSAACRERDCNVDLYQLHKYRRIVFGNVAHHIEELADAPDKGYSLDNLIWLSHKSHREVHSIYNRSPVAKKDLQEVLRDFVHRGARTVRS